MDMEHYVLRDNIMHLVDIIKSRQHRRSQDFCCRVHFILTPNVDDFLLVSILTIHITP